MTMEHLAVVLRSIWTVWFCLLFAGIAIWVYLPARRDLHAEHSRIPLKDDATNRLEPR